jgi:hypothetical protein
LARRCRGTRHQINACRDGNDAEQVAKFDVLAEHEKVNSMPSGGIRK